MSVGKSLVQGFGHFLLRLPRILLTSFRSAFGLCVTRAKTRRRPPDETWCSPSPALSGAHPGKLTLDPRLVTDRTSSTHIQAHTNPPCLPAACPTVGCLGTDTALTTAATSATIYRDDMALAHQEHTRYPHLLGDVFERPLELELGRVAVVDLVPDVEPEVPSSPRDRRPHRRDLNIRSRGSEGRRRNNEFPVPIGQRTPGLQSASSTCRCSRGQDPTLHATVGSRRRARARGLLPLRREKRLTSGIETSESPSLWSVGTSGRSDPRAGKLKCCS